MFYGDVKMFHNIKEVFPLKDYKLRVVFINGTEEIYDVSSLFDVIPSFCYLKDNPKCFFDVHPDTGGYGVSWNEDLDLSAEELWNNGKDKLNVED